MDMRIAPAQANSNDNSADQVICRRRPAFLSQSRAAVAPAGAHTGHRATERYLGRLVVRSHPFSYPLRFLRIIRSSCSIWVTRLAMRSRRVFSCGSRSLTSTNVSIRCTCSRISRRWLLIASPVAAARSAKLRSVSTLLFVVPGEELRDPQRLRCSVSRGELLIVTSSHQPLFERQARKLNSNFGIDVEMHFGERRHFCRFAS